MNLIHDLLATWAAVLALVSLVVCIHMAIDHRAARRMDVAADYQATQERAALREWLQETGRMAYACRRHSCVFCNAGAPHPPPPPAARVVKEDRRPTHITPAPRKYRTTQDYIDEQAARGIYPLQQPRPCR